MPRLRKSTLSLLAFAAMLGCLVALAAGSAAAAKRAPHRPSKETVSLKVDVVRGRKVLATGKVRPVPSRGTIVLQLRSGGTWRKLGRAPLVGHGAFSVRAVIPPGLAGTGASASTDVRLRAELFVRHRRVAISKVRTAHLEVPKPSPTPGPPPATTPSTGSPSNPPTPSEPPCTPAADRQCPRRHR